MRYISIIIITVLGFVTVQAMAGKTMEHSGHGMASPLTEPGNDAFAAIQEVVVKLMADPDTDWSKVNLEALRQHLIDMNNFTYHVAVLDKKDIETGVEFRIKANNKAVHSSLQRMFSAHPAMLKQESGWNMSVTENNNKTFTVQVNTQNPEEVAMIRGLGYIGIIAYGQHHQQHHWMMASGKNPHHGH